MNSTAVIAGAATITFALAGMVSFALESSPAALGLDGDNPRQMVQWVRDQPEVYGQAGIALLAKEGSCLLCPRCLRRGRWLGPRRRCAPRHTEASWRSLSRLIDRPD